LVVKRGLGVLWCGYTAKIGCSLRHHWKSLRDVSVSQNTLKNTARLYMRHAAGCWRLNNVGVSINKYFAS